MDSVTEREDWELYEQIKRQIYAKSGADIEAEIKVLCERMEI